MAVWDVKVRKYFFATEYSDSEQLPGMMMMSHAYPLYGHKRDNDWQIQRYPYMGISACQYVGAGIFSMMSIYGRKIDLG